MSESEPEHVGRMDVLTFWICSECGMAASAYSKRHQVRRIDEQFVELDQPCPICRENQWSELYVIGVMATESDFPRGGVR